MKQTRPSIVFFHTIDNWTATATLRCRKLLLVASYFVMN